VLDASETEVDPQNPNPRGFHGNDVEQDPLDEIIRMFNERWSLSSWDATPEERNEKLIKIVDIILKNPDYQTQVVDNPDEQNSRIATKKFIQQAMNEVRRGELGLYKLYATDTAFEDSLDITLIRLLAKAHAQLNDDTDKKVA